MLKSLFLKKKKSLFLWELYFILSCILHIYVYILCMNNISLFDNVKTYDYISFQLSRRNEIPLLLWMCTSTDLTINYFRYISNLIVTFCNVKVSIVFNYNRMFM